MGGVAPAVDFLRPAADERHRRALFVLPIQTGHPFSVEFSSSLRNQHTASALVLPGPERAFDHGHASVLPHSSGAGLAFGASTPILAGLAPEDFVLVADQILRSRIDASKDAFQKRTYASRVGFLGKPGPGHQTARVRVAGHGDPPTKRPARWQRARNPGRPNARDRRYDRQVEVPPLVRALRGNHASGRSLWLLWDKLSRLPQPPSYCCRGQVQTRTREYLGDLDLAHGGTKGL